MPRGRPVSIKGAKKAPAKRPVGRPRRVLGGFDNDDPYQQIVPQFVVPKKAIPQPPKIYNEMEHGLASVNPHYLKYPSVYKAIREEQYLERDPLDITPLSKTKKKKSDNVEDYRYTSADTREIEYTGVENLFKKNIRDFKMKDTPLLDYTAQSYNMPPVSADVTFGDYGQHGDSQIPLSGHTIPIYDVRRQANRYTGDKLYNDIGPYSEADARRDKDTTRVYNDTFNSLQSDYDQVTNPPRGSIEDTQRYANQLIFEDIKRRSQTKSKPTKQQIENISSFPNDDEGNIGITSQQIAEALVSGKKSKKPAGKKKYYHLEQNLVE